MKKKAEAAMETLAELGVRVSRREYEVLRLVAGGRSNGEIARELNIATGTAKIHVRNIFRNNGWRSREETYALAALLGVTAGTERPSMVKLLRACRGVDTSRMTESEVRTRLDYLVKGIRRIAGSQQPGTRLTA